jgi:dTDP-4-dehydrorhamnose reductase
VLGRAIVEACRARRIACVVVSHGEADVGSEEAVRRAVVRYAPWAVVNTAGRSAPGAAERSPEDAARVHVHGPEVLARVAAGLPVVSFSSADVFWSVGARFHREGCLPSPRSALGRTRLEGERRLLAAHARALVLRTGPPFGGIHPPAGLESNVLATPVHLPAVGDAVLELLLDEVTGLVHLAHREACTGVGWQLRCKALEERVRPADTTPIPEASRALDSERFHVLSSLDSALQAWRAEVPAGPAALAG